MRAPRHHRQPGLPLQARLVGWVLLLVLTVLALTVVASQALLRRQVDTAVAEELRGEVAELRLLAEEGRDPATGGPFTDVADLLDLHLRRSLPDPGETMFIVVDGQVRARSDDTPPTRLDLDPRFLQIVAGSEQTVYGSYSSDGGPVRFAVAPVQVGDEQAAGSYVVAIFTDRELDPVRQAGLVTLAVAGIALIPAAVLSWVLAGRALAPVRMMRQTAHQISEADLRGRIPVRHAPDSLLWDELDDLAATFNEMLDRLGVSFAAQRRFVDDAGHELRTPLTIVRGHVELMSEDDPRHPDALALVSDELDRMGRLVADLQTLTKSSQPQFLTRSPVDVAALTESVRDRAAALADRDWQVAEVAHVVVDADRHRLLQAMLQLASNAAAHTGPGQPIWIGSRQDGDMVRLWVRDSGPGVDPDLAEHIFDRFVHEPDGTGAGLGLSIVEAIARAHGGWAELTDPGPPGATFALVLPTQPGEDR